MPFSPAVRNRLARFIPRFAKPPNSLKQAAFAGCIFPCPEKMVLLMERWRVKAKPIRTSGCRAPGH